MTRKELYKKRKEAGKCVYCGRDKDNPARALCSRCRALHAMWDRKRRQRGHIPEPREVRKAWRPCPDCGHRTPDDRCVECYEKHLNQWAELEQPMEWRPCHDCGRVTTDYRCPECRMKHLIKWAEKSEVFCDFSSLPVLS